MSTVDFSDCVLDKDELKGIGLTPIGTKVSKGTRQGQFFHDCLGCNYIFAFRNTRQDHQLLSVRVSAEVFNPQDVRLKLQYRNQVELGQYINYEINPASNPDIQPNLETLTITIKTISGDADLFLSTYSANPDKKNSAYMSRRFDYIDQVTIGQAGDKQFLN